MTRPTASMPRSIHTVGLWVFLIALAVLFGSSMLGYVLIRLNGPQNISQFRGTLHVPALFWVSTALVLGVSVSLHQAVSSLRYERHKPFGVWLRAALALAVGFIAVQTPAMVMLLHEHAVYRTKGLHVYGLIFFLVLLHALHVVGGVVALVRNLVLARRGLYDHENYLPIYHTMLYWHFLDVVWLVMFGIFLLVR